MSEDTTAAGIQTRIREQAQQGLLSWLNPFNWGMGGLLLMGLIGFGLYYFGFTDRGREMLGNFFNGLSPEWQERLSGLASTLGLLPDGLDGQSATALMAIARRHGVTGFSTEAYLQPDIIYDALIEQPQAVLSMARGLPRGGNGAPNETTRRAMDAVRAIVNNPERMATLLSPTHRANTFALLDTLSPVPFAPGALGTFITAVGLDSNGRPKPEFLAFINGALNPDETQRNAAMLTYLGQIAESNPQALQALARSTQIDQITDPRIRAMMQGMQSLTGSPESVRAGVGVATDLQRQGSSVESLLTEASTITGLVTIMTTPEKLALLTPNLQRFGVLANSARGTAAENSPQRVILDFFSTGQTIDGQRGVAVNVRALHTFFTSVAQDPANRANIGEVRDVMRGMMVMMGFPTSDGETIPPLNAQQVARFFRNEANVRAFDTLLQQINPDRLPQGMREAIGQLRTNWAPRGNGDNSYMDNGLAEVFASPRSIEYLLNPENRGSGWSDYIPNAVESFFARWTPTSISGLPQAIRDNSDYLIAVRDALANAGVTMDGAAAAPARAQGDAPMRAS